MIALVQSSFGFATITSVSQVTAWGSGAVAKRFTVAYTGNPDRVDVANTSYQVFASSGIQANPATTETGPIFLPGNSYTMIIMLYKSGIKLAEQNFTFTA